MKPKIHVVRLAELCTWSIGADGSVLKAGPGTVTSAVGAGVPSSSAACVGSGVVFVWLTGGTYVRCVGAGVCTGLAVGFGFGVALGFGVEGGGGGGVAMHDVGSDAQPAKAIAGVPTSAATSANAKRPLPQCMPSKSLQRKRNGANGTRVVCWSFRTGRSWPPSSRRPW